MSSSETESEVEVKRRKGVRNEFKYKRNVIKHSKVAGKKHINWKGKTVEARKTGNLCRCRMKCYEKITKEYLNEQLNYFNNFQTKNEQDLYLQGLISSQNIRRKRNRNNTEKKPKTVSYKYYLVIENKRIEICKTTFVSVHGISNGRLYRICKLLSLGQSPHDKRGENRSGNAIPAEVTTKIHEHIETYPTKTSHYCGKEKQYLDARLSVKKMYQMFTEKYPDIKVCYYFFLSYFRQNFSLSFGRPQVDTCTVCEELGIKIRNRSLNDLAKRVFAAELMVHKRRSKKFYNKIKEVEELCKARSDVGGLCFDYMSNLPLPNIPVQDIFYFRQLWVYSFGIHNIATNKAKMYMYHEGIAKKTPNEVCSFLTDYIDMHIPVTVKELHLFSDNCSGQNKNHTFLRFLSALTDSGRFDKIFYYLPIRGHSFLPCDRDFGLIKRVVRKEDRTYTPEEYAVMVRRACNKKDKFTINMVETNDIFEFKGWWTGKWKKTVTSIETKGRSSSREQKKNFNISKFYEFEFDNKKQGIITTYDFIDGFMKHTFRLRLTKEPVPLPTDKAYNNKVPINKKKQNDIEKIKQYIPDEYEYFYNEVLNWPTKEEEHGDSEAEV